MDEPILSGYLSNAENTAGEWVSFPTTAEQMRETADRIGIDFHNRKTWYFREYQSAIPGMTENFDRQESPDELNYLGRLLSMQFDDDREKFMAAVTLGDHVSSVKELINLAQNLDCYWIYPQIHTEEQYAHYLLEELGEIELPEKAEKYFLYKEYGRDAVKDDGGKFREWREMFVAQMVSAFGPIIAMKLYFLLVPTLVSGQIDYNVNTYTEMCINLFIVIGGAFAVYKSRLLLVSVMNPMAAGSMAESGIIGSFISGKVMGGIQSKLAGGGSSQSQQQPRRASKSGSSQYQTKSQAYTGK